MKTKTLLPGKFPKTYAQLASVFMPRPVRDKVDYENACEVLESMAGFKMNKDQSDYFDAIATFVEKYESQNHPVKGTPMSPIQLITSMMEEHGLSESDLGRILGDRSLGHRILKGKRELSKMHIRVLSKHFALDPAALL